MIFKLSYGRELEEVLQRTGRQPALLHDFLTDLLSPAEYRDLAVRWQIIRLLDRGFSHRDISRELGVGVATVTRGVRELANAQGGFAKVLKKHYKKKSTR